MKFQNDAILIHFSCATNRHKTILFVLALTLLTFTLFAQNKLVTKGSLPVAWTSYQKVATYEQDFADMKAHGIGLVDLFQNVKSNLGQILDRGHAVNHHGFVVGQAVQKVPHHGVVCIHNKGVVPKIHKMLVGQRLDVAKVHDHAVVRLAVLLHHIAGQGNEQGVAVAMQVAALAVVVGNAVTGIEFHFSGDGEHGRRVG